TRKMVQMVQTINRTNFSGRKVVSCWTCHRQSDRPQVTPTLDVVYGEPIYWAPDDLFQQAPGAPKPDEVLDKYIQAVGGTERLSKLTSLVGKGSATLFGGGFKSPVELYVKAPNQRTTIIHQELGDKTMTFDGRAGWLGSARAAGAVAGLSLGGGDGGAGAGSDRRRARWSEAGGEIVHSRPHQAVSRPMAREPAEG